MAIPGYGKQNLRPGFALQDGLAINRLIARAFQGGITRQDNITATAGGTKAAAFPLVSTLNHITTVATAGDSVMLPKAIAGSRVVVRNDGANSLNVFSQGNDTISGNSAATALALAAGKATELVCFTVGAWFVLSVQA